MLNPVRVAVTGATGQIAYSLLFRIASGEMLGQNQPIILQLLDITPAMQGLEGVAMELDDCAFPLLEKTILTDDADTAFQDASYALLVGAKPRGAGMERSDLLASNSHIFKAQGKALDKHARRDVKVLVVGNPANTNAYTAKSNAPSLDQANFTAMTRLDHNRALAQLSFKTNIPVSKIKKMTIWGNHSSTQYPDLRHAEIGGKPAVEYVDQDWYTQTFISSVANRGAEIIKARGLSSAASAASSAIQHMRDWTYGTETNNWTSMAVPSDGSYDIPEGLVFSFPVRCEDGKYHIVSDLILDEFDKKMLDITKEELQQELKAVEDLF